MRAAAEGRGGSSRSSGGFDDEFPAAENVANGDAYDDEEMGGEAAQLQGGDAPVEEEEEHFWALRELLRAAGVKPVRIDSNLPEDEDLGIFGVCTDSREAQPDDMFICVKGFTHDGHDFVEQAVRAGVGAVVVCKDMPNIGKYIEEGVVIVTVEDTKTVAALLAATFYNNPSRDMTMIGITGTNGKTTTAWLVRGILDTLGQETGLIGTTGYELGSLKFNANGTVWAPEEEDPVKDMPCSSPGILYPYKGRYSVKNTTPDAVQMQQILFGMQKEGAGACVAEVTSIALDQGRTDLVDFDVAVFTNLSRDHMDYHGTFEAYRESKAALFASLNDPSRQRAVINLDDDEAEFFFGKVGENVPVITYSALPPDKWPENRPAPDVYPTVADLSLFDTVLEISTPAGAVSIVSMLIGTPNVANVCAAVAVGCALGISLDMIADGIQSLSNGVPGRLELVDEKQEFAVIVDYAHTPDALERTLRTVRKCGAQRIITIFGCGGDRDQGKRPLMGEIAHALSDTVIVTNDNPRFEDDHEILEDIVSGFDSQVYNMKEVLRKAPRFPFLKDYRMFEGDEFYEDDKWVAMQFQSIARRFVIADRAYAIRAGLLMAGEGDAVVIAGKGHEDYIIQDDRKYWFSDQVECRYLLKQLDKRPSSLETYSLPWRCKGWPSDMNNYIDG